MEDLQALKSKAIKGSLWGILERFSIQIIQFVVGIILARILGPKEFGLNAITVVFSGVIQAIVDAGFEKAIIYQKDIRNIQINTIFYVNLLIGLFMTTILFTAAPFIAHYFNDQVLSSLLRAVSIGILIGAFGQTQRTLLLRDLNFKKLSYTQILSTLTGGIAGVVLACNGFGVWALVYSILISQTISLISYWIKADWYPQLQFSFNSIKQMVPYGSKILMSSILFYFNLQFINLVVGRNFNKEQFGLFNRGAKLPELITATIQGFIIKMAFPVFSKLQDDNIQLTNVFKKALCATAFFLFPFLIIIYTCSRDLTILLFTEKWSGSIVFLEWFCFIRLFDPLIGIYKEAILAKGKASLLFRIFLFVAILNTILILILVKFGLIYLLIGCLASMVVQYIIYMYFFSVNFNVKIVRQIGWLMPYLVIFVSTILCIKLEHFYLKNYHLNLIMDLFLKVISIVLIYIFLSVQFKIDEVKLILETSSKFRKRILHFIKLKIALS